MTTSAWPITRVALPAGEMAQASAISRIVLEASGGYEIAIASELAAAGLPLAALNPRQVRDFAPSYRSVAKNRRDRCASAGTVR